MYILTQIPFLKLRNSDCQQNILDQLLHLHDIFYLETERRLWHILPGNRKETMTYFTWKQKGDHDIFYFEKERGQWHILPGNRKETMTYFTWKQKGNHDIFYLETERRPWYILHESRKETIRALTTLNLREKWLLFQTVHREKW